MFVSTIFEQLGHYSPGCQKPNYFLWVVVLLLQSVILQPLCLWAKWSFISVRLLLIEESLWLPIHLSKQKFAHCPFNILSRNLLLRILLPYSLAPLLQIWSQVIQPFQCPFLVRKARPAFPCNFDSSSYTCTTFKINASTCH